MKQGLQGQTRAQRQGDLGYNFINLESKYLQLAPDFVKREKSPKSKRSIITWPPPPLLESSQNFLNFLHKNKVFHRLPTSVSKATLQMLHKSKEIFNFINNQRAYKHTKSTLYNK
jgi:hypothetical protein